MNTHYHMTIAGCERDLPICPLNDKLSIGAFVIFGDCELTQACATELLKKRRSLIISSRRKARASRLLMKWRVSWDAKSGCLRAKASSSI